MKRLIAHGVLVLVLAVLIFVAAARGQSPGRAAAALPEDPFTPGRYVLATTFTGPGVTNTVVVRILQTNGPWLLVEIWKPTGMNTAEPVNQRQWINPLTWTNTTWAVTEWRPN